MSNLQYWNEIYAKTNRSEDISWFKELGLDLKPKSRILEIGCGAGALSSYLADQGYQVNATDVSTVAIAKSHLRDYRVKWLVHDVVDSLPFTSQSFDMVVASLSLHYVDADEIQKILVDIGRILKRDGILVFRLNSSNDQEANKEQPIPRFYFTMKEVASILRGWKVLHLEEKRVAYFGKEKCLWEGIVSFDQ